MLGEVTAGWITFNVSQCGPNSRQRCLVGFHAHNYRRATSYFKQTESPHKRLHRRLLQGKSRKKYWTFQHISLCFVYEELVFLLRYLSLEKNPDKSSAWKLIIWLRDKKVTKAVQKKSCVCMYIIPRLAVHIKEGN